MDELFSRDAFDERDLVGIDKEINAKYQEIVKNSKGVEKATEETGSKGQQATLKKLDKLDDLQSHQQDDWEADRKTKLMKTYDMSTRYKASTLAKDQRTLPEGPQTLKTGSRKAPTTLDIRSRSYQNK